MYVVIPESREFFEIKGRVDFYLFLINSTLYDVVLSVFVFYK